MATASSIIGKGLLAARPAAATATAGNIYYATDTGLLYRDNGTTWDTIGSSTVGTVTTVSGTAPISVANGSTTPAITHDTSGVSAGTSSGITVDTKGHVTARTALSAGDLPAATTTAVGALKSPFLFASTADSTVANTTTETSLLGSGVGTLTLPANCLTAGRSLRFHMLGYWEDNASTVPSTFKLKLGSTVVASLSVQLAAGNVGGAPWMINALITCQTVGGAGKVMGQALMSMFDGSLGAMMGSSGVRTTTATIDTTVTQVADVTLTWDTADPSNTITCTNAIVELVG